MLPPTAYGPCGAHQYAASAAVNAACVGLSPEQQVQLHDLLIENTFATSPEGAGRTHLVQSHRHGGSSTYQAPVCPWSSRRLLKRFSVRCRRMGSSSTGCAGRYGPTAFTGWGL
ncbi:UNVERIFIED_CONTAM: hypothetical protein FKN15_069559 [Acipenser sinensis]